jgi:hypothetical protein
MRMDRQRPNEADKKDLAFWLSCLIHDACRDAREAGMPDRQIHDLLKIITDAHHPMGYDGVKHDLRKACEELKKK